MKLLKLLVDNEFDTVLVGPRGWTYFTSTLLLGEAELYELEDGTEYMPEEDCELLYTEGLLNW